MYKLGKRSIENLNTCHPDLILLANKAIQASPYDFGITHGYRSSDYQNELYQQGRTKPGEIVTNCDGYIKKSKHNIYPSEAFDIVCYINKKVVWTPEVYRIVASHIIDTASILFNNDEITNRIVWGGNFSSFIDYPHFQI